MHVTVIYNIIFDEDISNYPHLISSNTDEIKHLPLELKMLNKSSVNNVKDL